MNKVKSVLFIPIIIFIVAISTYFLLNYFSYSRQEEIKQPDKEITNNNNMKNIAGIIKKEEEKISDQIEEGSNLRINNETEVILKKIDRFSTDNKMSKIELNDSLLGLNKEELRAKLKLGKITQFNSNQIVIEIKESEQGKSRSENLDQFKERVIDFNREETADNSDNSRDGVQELNFNNKEDNIKEENIKEELFLGIKDGYLAIYKGDNLEERVLQEVREDIAIEDLSEQDKKSLVKGIKVSDRQELLAILEGFASVKEE